ncbi:MAG: GTP-binding protein [Vicinamibacterales bacterium]|jgi:hypothetical protein|nr:GTP-binding protein [Vicinamibacterales bacterium]
MISKKVCMLGGFAVGKTSLVARFVHGLFSDKYLTTIGVKIDKKTVPLDDQVLDVVLWDIYGEDDYQRVRTSYLRGASGLLLVADGTRRDTLEVARGLRLTARDHLGSVPAVLAINKADLARSWEIGPDEIDALRTQGWTVLETSAKTGDGVEAAFTALARMMLTA